MSHDCCLAVLTIYTSFMYTHQSVSYLFKYDHNINIEKSTFRKLNVFYYLWTLFSKLSILSHFDLKWQLYINLNTSKKFNFKTHIYHIKLNLLKTSSNNYIRLNSAKIALNNIILSMTSAQNSNSNDTLYQKNTKSNFF